MPARQQAMKCRRIELPIGLRSLLRFPCLCHQTPQINPHNTIGDSYIKEEHTGSVQPVSQLFPDRVIRPAVLINSISSGRRVALIAKLPGVQPRKESTSIQLFVILSISQMRIALIAANKTSEYVYSFIKKLKCTCIRHRSFNSFSSSHLQLRVKECPYWGGK
jgi:hypothetical protein